MHLILLPSTIGSGQLPPEIPLDLIPDVPLGDVLELEPPHGPDPPLLVFNEPLLIIDLPVPGVVSPFGDLDVTPNGRILHFQNECLLHLRVLPRNLFDQPQPSRLQLPTLIIQVVVHVLFAELLDLLEGGLLHFGAGQRD